MAVKQLFAFYATSCDGGQSIETHGREFEPRTTRGLSLQKIELDEGYMKPVVAYVLPVMKREPERLGSYRDERSLNLKPKVITWCINRRDIAKNHPPLLQECVLEQNVRHRGLEEDDSCSVVDRELVGTPYDYLMFPCKRNRAPNYTLEAGWWDNITVFLNIWLTLEELEFYDKHYVKYYVEFEYKDPLHPDRPTDFYFQVQCMGVSLGEFPNLLEAAFYAFKLPRCFPSSFTESYLKLSLLWRNMKTERIFLDRLNAEAHIVGLAVFQEEYQRLKAKLHKMGEVVLAMVYDYPKVINYQWRVRINVGEPRNFVLPLGDQERLLEIDPRPAWQEEEEEASAPPPPPPPPPAKEWPVKGVPHWSTNELLNAYTSPKNECLIIMQGVFLEKSAGKDSFRLFVRQALNLDMDLTAIEVTPSLGMQYKYCKTNATVDCPEKAKLIVKSILEYKVVMDKEREERAKRNQKSEEEALKQMQANIRRHKEAKKRMEKKEEEEEDEETEEEEEEEEETEEEEDEEAEEEEDEEAEEGEEEVAVKEEPEEVAVKEEPEEEEDEEAEEEDEEAEEEDEEAEEEDEEAEDEEEKMGKLSLEGTSKKRLANEDTSDEDKKRKKKSGIGIAKGECSKKKKTTK